MIMRGESWLCIINISTDHWCKQRPTFPLHYETHSQILSFIRELFSKEISKPMQNAFYIAIPNSQ